MPRYFAQITEDEFKQKFVDALNKNEEALEDVEEGMILTKSDVFFKNRKGDYFRSPEVIKYLNATVEKDLSKVHFDTENLYYTESDSDDCGIRTLPNGMVCLFAYAGGDWEIPVFFIIYWDGKKMRGYIPTDGNTFNRSTKYAYGNDGERKGLTDAEDALKNLGVPIVEVDDEDEDDYGPELDMDHDLLNFDMEKIKADIMKRIQVKG